MRILIAEDDPVSSSVLAAYLRDWGHEVLVTKDGLEAYQALREKDGPGLAILDWMMPGLSGADLCQRLRQEMTTSPVYLILLTALSSREKIVEGLKSGADDYLSKPFDPEELRGRLNTGLRIIELQNKLAQRVGELEEAIIERKQVEEQLRNQTLTDDLTGVYNHRGFFTIAEHQLKIARRTAENSMIFYADMDGLKHINDTLGHLEGSRAISATVAVLRQTFRESDVIGRLGGDEFAILAANVRPNMLESVTARLRQNLRAYNEQNENEYLLSLSIGAVSAAYDTTDSVAELVAAADRLMYEEKRQKKSATAGLDYGTADSFAPNPQ
jgi:two-component system cell cycle response regulator